MAEIVKLTVAGTTYDLCENATASVRGLVSTTAQTFAGVKTFQDGLYVENSSATIDNNLTVGGNITSGGTAVVLTNDSRMTNSRPASDVSAWAKAATKPTYTASEVGAVPITRTVNGKALSADINLTASDVGAAASSHTHTIANVTNLQATLNGKMGFSYVTQTVSVNGSESSPMRININALTKGVLTIVAINAASYNYSVNYGRTFLPSGGTYCVIYVPSISVGAGEGTKILAGGTSLETFDTPSSHNTVQKVYAIIRLS